MSSKTILIAVLSALAATCNAQFTPIAYEGFSYDAGTLAGQNGGTGWTGSWINDYGSGTSFNVSATGMTYPGLTTSGGRMVWASGGNGISEDSRSLALLNSGVVYLQFLSQFGSSSGGGTPNIRLYQLGNLTGGIGGNGGIYGANMSILDTSLQPATDGTSSSSALLSDLNLVIVRIDHDANNTAMWVNPDLTTFDYQNPSGANASYAGLAPAFDSIGIYSRSPGAVDELTVLVPVPEPASCALLLMGIGLVCYRWRRKKI